MSCFIGLNPSTADETMDDPTVRRCINFAKDWGFGGMVMMNLFAYRATDPNLMKSQTQPTGPLNDQALRTVVELCGRTICCWGTHGIHRNREFQVKSLLADRRLHHLGLTKGGHPKHPLYLGKTTEPQHWRDR